MAWTDWEARGGTTRFGSGVLHISHVARAGWLMKVHTGQAVSSLVTLGGLTGLGDAGEDVDTRERGVDEERGPAIEADAASERGTPQRAHIREAAGLRPGGLR